MLDYECVLKGAEGFEYTLRCSAKPREYNEKKTFDIQILDIVSKEKADDEGEPEDPTETEPAASDAETTLESEEEGGEKDGKEDEMWKM